MKFVTNKLNCKIFIVACSLFSVFAEAAKSTALTNLYSSTCKPGLRDAPDGPYAVFVACEDSLGNYISVVRKGAIGAPVEGKWTLINRHWAEEPWSADVTSYIWVQKGKMLIVATQGYYGTAGIYTLDLKNRKYLRIFPKEVSQDEISLTITKVDESKGEVSFTKTSEGKKSFLSVKY